MSNIVSVLIVGGHREAGQRGTIKLRDGRIVTQAPDDIGRADRILVTLDDGRTCWVVRNDIVIQA